MKRTLSLIALFVLTWETIVAMPHLYDRLPTIWGCELVNRTEFFDDEMKALARETALRMDKTNINVKIYEAKPLKMEYIKELPKGAHEIKSDYNERHGNPDDMPPVRI